MVPPHLLAQGPELWMKTVSDSTVFLQKGRHRGLRLFSEASALAETSGKEAVGRTEAATGRLCVQGAKVNREQREHKGREQG